MAIGNFKAISRKGLEEESGNKPTRFYSKKQEDKVAKSLGGRRNLNSGATMFDKGDVSLDNWLLECKTKTTPSGSISIKKEWIQKNKEESLFMGKDYEAIVFSFGPGQENYYVIDENLFKILVEYLENEE